MRKPLILIIPGSTRKESIHRKLAVESVAALTAAGAETVLADLRDYPMPLYDGDLETKNGMPTEARLLKELARKADGFLIASPEYNGSYPGVLKNAIDWISRPEAGERPLEVFRGKVAAILSATPGPLGGSRVLKHLSELLGTIRVNVVEQLGIPDSAGTFDGEGRLAREKDAAGLRSLASTVVRAAAQTTTAA
jgi:chromate reductase, NAD(P)H dehydrogenase (quinone)